MNKYKKVKFNNDNYVDSPDTIGELIDFTRDRNGNILCVVVIHNKLIFCSAYDLIILNDE